MSLGQASERRTCWRRCSARPRLPTNFGQSSAAAAARYVTAVSQRAGMRRTLCSPLCERTCWDSGAAGPDITAQAARPRALPPQVQGPGLSSHPGDSWNRGGALPSSPAPKPQDLSLHMDLAAGAPCLGHGETTGGRAAQEEESGRQGRKDQWVEQKGHRAIVRHKGCRGDTIWDPWPLPSRAAVGEGSRA